MSTHEGLHIIPENVLKLIDSFPVAALILDIGGGDRKIQGRDAINIDLINIPGVVDIICDAHNLPFRDNTFDLVISQSVIEHLPKPWIAAAEFYRVCKQNGFVYIDGAFIQGVHGYPSHYFNMTRMGIETLFSKFTKISSGVQEYQRPSYAVTWILSAYFLSFFKRDAFVDLQETSRRSSQSIVLGKHKVTGYILVRGRNTLLRILKYMDRWIKPSNMENISAGVFFLGKKE